MGVIVSNIFEVEKGMGHHLGDMLVQRAACSFLETLAVLPPFSVHVLYRAYTYCRERTSIVESLHVLYRACEPRALFSKPSLYLPPSHHQHQDHEHHLTPSAKHPDVEDGPGRCRRTSGHISRRRARVLLSSLLAAITR